MLQPNYRNFKKRVIKSPKLYFHDTGLRCWLLGIRAYAQIEVDVRVIAATNCDLKAETLDPSDSALC